MRTKTAYEIGQKENGKATVQRVGTKPVQREGVEYEFSVCGSIDLDHLLSITKTRCPALDQSRAVKPGPAFIEPYIVWLNEGVDTPPPGSVTAVVNQAGQVPPQTAAPIYSAADTDPADEVQRERMIEIAKRLGMDAADVKKVIQRRKHADGRVKQTIFELTRFEAAELIVRMEAKLAEFEIPF